MFRTVTLKIETGHMAKMFTVELYHVAEDRNIVECPDRSAAIKTIVDMMTAINKNKIVSVDMSNRFGEIKYQEAESKNTYYIQYEIKDPKND